MKAVDLLPFCAKYGSRMLLQQPFTVGERTYATDARVLVRVNRIAGVYLVNVTNSGWNAIKFQACLAMVAPLPTDIAVALPDAIPEVLEACDVCDGNGLRNGEPCPNCEGAGHFEQHHPIDVGGTSYAGYHLRRLAALPDLAFYPRHGTDEPAYFTFTRGDGILMPL